MHATAVARGDDALNRLIATRVAGNISEIPRDSIDLELMRRFPTTITISDPAVESFVRSLSVREYADDPYTMIITSSYGSGLHAIARRNIERLTDTIITPLFAALDIEPNEVEYLHSPSVSTRLDNVAVCFRIGQGSRIVVNQLKKMIEAGIELGLVAQLNDDYVLVTLPFYQNSIFVKNHFI